MQITSINQTQQKQNVLFQLQLSAFACGTTDGADDNYCKWHIHQLYVCKGQKKLMNVDIPHMITTEYVWGEANNNLKASSNWVNTSLAF